MKDQSFTTSFVVEQTPKEVFDAISNVRGWWSEQIDGRTDMPGAEFRYWYQDVHRCTLKVVEMVQDRKIVWHVLDNYFNFTKDKSEWKGTDMVFEISKKGKKTEVRFTHVGLVPAYECHDICSEAWSNYINSSLRDLIATGKGQPNPIEEIVTRARTMRNGG